MGCLWYDVIQRDTFGGIALVLVLRGWSGPVRTGKASSIADRRLRSLHAVAL